MRNLIKYPVTSDEVIRVLDTIPAYNVALGDLQDTIRLCLIKYASENMQSILKRMEVTQEAVDANDGKCNHLTRKQPCVYPICDCMYMSS